MLIESENGKLEPLGDEDIIAKNQDEYWNARYNELKDFIEKNHRNPSLHRLEEHDMLNWLKSNRIMRQSFMSRLLSCLKTG